MVISNTAVQFNGTNYVEIPDSVDFSQPTSTYGLTVEAWMRPDALSFPGEASPDSTQNPYVHWLGKAVRSGSSRCIAIFKMTAIG